MRSGDNGQKTDLLGTARQRAFNTYLRYGRMPEGGAGRDEQKALSPLKDYPPVGTLPRPTRHYVWHTAGDDRVRSTHALNHGRIFAWHAPPPGGHPGTEPNCRCWPIPYFGDPAIPDNLQPLQHASQADTSGTAGWSSIETLTRPDGSLAESVVVLADGTRVQSAFWRTLIARTVTLTTGGKVRIETDAGVQTVYLGNDEVPLFQSAWTVKGPVVIRARRRVAFLLERGPFWPDQQLYADPGPGGTTVGGAGLASAAQALFGLYAVQWAAPASQGLGESDKPTIAFRTWTVEGRPGSISPALPVFAGTLTEEQIRQSCHRVADVQRWIDEAAALLEAEKGSLSPQQYGNAVHEYVHRKIKGLKTEFPGLYADLSSETSFLLSGAPAHRGQKYSVRYDVKEVIPPDEPERIYDTKTGGAALRWDQVKKIGWSASAQYPNATIVIVQMGISQFPANGPR